MFDVGLGELAVIAFVAVLVLGPDKLPDLARQAAVMIRKFREVANSARDELRSELGPEFSDLELRDLDPREMVRKQIAEAMAEADGDAGEGSSATAVADRSATRPRDALPEGAVPPWDPEAT